MVSSKIRFLVDVRNELALLGKVRVSEKDGKSERERIKNG